MDNTIKKTGKRKLSELDLISSNEGKKIAWQYFLNFTNPTNVSKEVKSDLWKNHQNNYNKKKSWTHSYVNTLTKLWLDKKPTFFINSRISQKRKGILNSIRKHPLDYYKFNLNPFFEMLDIDNIQLTQQQKNIISFIFDDEDVRKNMYLNYKDIGFTEAIIKYYIKMFYIPVLRHKGKEVDIFKRFKIKDADKVITDYLLEHIINNSPKGEIRYQTDLKFHITGDKRILTDKHPTDETIGNISFKAVSISKTKTALIHFKQTEMRYIYYKLYKKYYDIINDLNFKMLRAGKI